MSKREYKYIVQESLTNLFCISGIVIEEEHLDTTDSTATRRKTTSITLTTAENAANKANNQIHNQGKNWTLDNDWVNDNLVQFHFLLYILYYLKVIFSNVIDKS